MIELTDFGIPLYEVLNDVRTSHPGSTDSEQIEIAKNVILGLVEKGLVSLCKLTPENTKNHVYEVSESTSMPIDDIKRHMSLLINWEQSVDALDSSVSYELAPTYLGEKVLDEIFSTKQGS